MDILCCIKLGKKSEPVDAKSAESVLYKFFRKFYAPFILSKPMRVIIGVGFLGWLCASVAVAPHIEVGLAQELSMPTDSYMLNYFDVSEPAID